MQTEFKTGDYVRFTADWCGPCKNYAPVYEKASAADPEHDYHVVDIDKDPAIAREYGIRSIPSVVLVTKDGFEKIDPYSLR